MWKPSLLLLAALALGCTTTEPKRSPPPRRFVALPVATPAARPPEPAPIATLTDTDDSLRAKLRRPFALYNLTNVKRPLREILGALGAAIPARITFDGAWSTEVEATLHVRAFFTWHNALCCLSGRSGGFDWSVRDGAIHITPATEGPPIYIAAKHVWIRLIDQQMIEATDDDHRLLWRMNVQMRASAQGIVDPRRARRWRLSIASCGCIAAAYGGYVWELLDPRTGDITTGPDRD